VWDFLQASIECDKKESFMHSIMSPIYKAADPEEGKLATNEFTSKLTWSIMIFLMIITGLRIVADWGAVKASFACNPKGEAAKS
jgi:peptidoglycan biosynthesis protein MviN/MurJ (putative lipid II flippase)